MPGPRNWQDRYYDGEQDDVFAVFADDGTPEDVSSGFDMEITHMYTVSEEEWEWLQTMLAEPAQIIPSLYKLMNPEEGDGDELE